MQFFKLSALAALVAVAAADEAPTYSTITTTTTRTVMRVVNTVTATSSYSAVAVPSGYSNGTTPASSGYASGTGALPTATDYPIHNGASSLAGFSAAGLAAVAGAIGYVVM